MAGRPVGPLAGVPVGIKDLVETKGIRTTSGSFLYKISFRQKTMS